MAMTHEGPVSAAEPPERVAQRRPEAGGGVALPASSVSERILQLQRSHGNRHVQRMVALARQAVAQAEGGALDPEVESSIQRARGGGQALDGASREQMESAFGSDFSSVRIHTGGEADRLNRAVSARAFTTGNDVFFRQGEYNPGSSSGRELLAHELTHVVQQNGAPIQAKLTLGPVDDPAEREADEMARSVVQRSAAPAAQRQGPGGVLRRWPAEEETPEYPIEIPRDIKTTEQLLRYIEVRIFGRVVNAEWNTSGEPAALDPAKHVGKSVRFLPSRELIELHGIAQTTPEEKAEDDETYEGLDPEEKGAVDGEIDQRYYESMKIAPGTRIKRGEKGKAAVWNSLKAQVLAERKLAQLPEAIKALFGPENLTSEHARILLQIGGELAQLSEEELEAFFVTGPGGAVITPDDYPRLLDIARKLAALPPEARKDYLGRVSASTTSLADLDHAIDRYVGFRMEREEQVQEHETAAGPLLGAEDVYTLYRDYLARKDAMRFAEEMDRSDALLKYLDARDALAAALEHKKLGTIDEFAAMLESYRLAFRTQAVNLALDVLDRYDHMLFEERRKLEQGGAATIAQGIAGSNASEHYEEYHQRQEAAQNLLLLRDGYDDMASTEPYVRAISHANEAKEQAESEVLRGSGNDPLIAERNVDLEKLAGLDAGGTHAYLTELIAERSAQVEDARKQFKEDPDRVFSMKELVAATHKHLGSNTETVYGRSIQDYIDEEAMSHLLSQAALGILAVALAFLVPGGGWLAAGALVAQAGISSYQVYTAYQEYQEQERDYELGFLSEEPSLFWVGLAIAGAALDLGVAATLVVKQSATALKALKEPMLEFSKDSRTLPKLLAQIEAAQGLDLKLKAALAREARASLAAREAWKDLFSQAGRLHGFAGLAVDPGLVKQLFRALYYSIKRGVNSITRLSADAKFLEITGDLTRMSGAERAQLETAFEEVKQLVQVGQAKNMDEKSLLGFVDRWALNRGKPGFQDKLAEEMKIWKPLTAEQRTALNALEAQKRTVSNLYDQKAIAEEELAALRAQPDRTPEDVAEIRSLEAEIRALDPQALPGARPGAGRGKIAEAESTLAIKETEAARTRLTLYDRLRAAAPSEAAKERALKGVAVDQVGPLKTRPTSLQADHIVSVREISDMDGFTDLPWKDQKAIVDMKENLIAMDGAANASKGDRTWRSWSQGRRFYEQSTIDAMAKREAEVRALIEAEIKKRSLRPPAAGTAGTASTAGSLRYGLIDNVSGVNVRRAAPDLEWAKMDPLPGDLRPGLEGLEKELLDAVEHSKDIRPGSMIVREAERLLLSKGDLWFSPSRPLSEEYTHDFQALIDFVKKVMENY